MASPYKTPSAINERRGNPGKRGTNKKEPKYQESTGKPPKELRDKVAIEEWKQMVALLKPSGVMTVADERALLLYCNSFSLYAQAQKTLDSTDYVLTTPTGTTMHNPWCSVRSKAYAECEKMLIQFGLTPCARTRVQAAGAEKKSDIDLFIEDAV